MLGIVGVVRDVTERLAAEADVATLRAIVDAAEEAIVGVDRKGDILFFSPSAERLYGWRADEVIGRPVTVLIADAGAPPAAGGASAPCRRARRSAARASRGARTAPTSRPSSTPARSWAPDGRMQGTALIVLDISARRRAQRMLERFVEHAPNVIAVKDLDGRYLIFSTHGASLVRRHPEDLIGLTDREIYGDAIRRPARGPGSAGHRGGRAARRSRTPGRPATAGS